MSVKDVIKQSWEDLKSLEFNFQNLCILAIATIIASTIISPLLGIPIGLLGSAYYIQSRKRNKA
ncbi:VraH family peptide resistance protein [Staphylococcus agnetis]|uniref:VraH family peptide resistance protein n=1 Tax=Staphylococcus agnetis TaxID=985762 RepID=UPI000D1B4E9D|nr:hypothetical protein [Staphylococcus agnetis]PTH57646.1 hypothetical protein BU584_07745 [Staphylococcus agnetis]